MITTVWARYGDAYKCTLGAYGLYVALGGLNENYCAAVFHHKEQIAALELGKATTPEEARDWCEETMLAHAEKNGIDLDGVT